MQPRLRAEKPESNKNEFLFDSKQIAAGLVTGNSDVNQSPIRLTRNFRNPSHFHGFLEKIRGYCYSLSYAEISN